MIDCPPSTVIDHQEVAIDLKCIVMENEIINCKVSVVGYEVVVCLCTVCV